MKNSDSTTTKVIKKAFLIATYQGSGAIGAAEKLACEEHLNELDLLVDTFGSSVVHKEACHLRQFDAATFLTKGKLAELVAAAKAYEADLIIFDDEISPAQQRNLEKEFGKDVIDRTEVILEVFAQRAQTKEAKLQIELAKLRYEAPRLKRLWTHLSRQAGTAGSGGGGGYLKGEGEKQIEIDRRILKKKIANLQASLDEVKSYRETQRQSRQRSEIPVLAIIGYTNAGKSTLLNALTEAEVLVENKLFATLDTTTRKFTMSNHQEVLLIDTVGFIRKLPHLLVAAFRSTLEESLQADILLHLIDASHPLAIEQAETTYQVLKELNAGERPIITVLNKVDLCSASSTVSKLRMLYPKNVRISAKNGQGFDKLEEAIIAEINRTREVSLFKIPQAEYHIVSEIIQKAEILKQEYEGNFILIQASMSHSLASQLSKYKVDEK